MSFVPYSRKWYVIAEVIASTCRSVDNVQLDSVLVKKVSALMIHVFGRTKRERGSSFVVEMCIKL